MPFLQFKKEPHCVKWFFSDNFPNSLTVYWFNHDDFLWKVYESRRANNPHSACTFWRTLSISYFIYAWSGWSFLNSFSVSISPICFQYFIIHGSLVFRTYPSLFLSSELRLVIHQRCTKQTMHFIHEKIGLATCLEILCKI